MGTISYSLYLVHMPLFGCLLVATGAKPRRLEMVDGASNAHVLRTGHFSGVDPVYPEIQ